MAFELYTDKKGEYRFRLKAKNGQNILASEGYTTKAAAENGIRSVKENATERGQFELKEAKNGQFHFVLKAKNHQVIGSSELYSSKSGAENGIESVMNNAPGAEVKEVQD